MENIQLDDVIGRIPDFTLADYSQNAAPYAWLYSFTDNPFVLRVLLEELCRRAASLGFRSFRQYFGDYRRQLAQNAVSVSSADNNTTCFIGQPLVLNCGKYDCGGRVTYLNMLGLEVEVCPHPIMPTKRLINIETGETKYEIAFSRGGNWKALTVDAYDIFNASRITALSRNGVSVTSETAKYLVAYLQCLEALNHGTIPTVRSVSRLGWIGDNVFSPYFDEDLNECVFDGSEGYEKIFDNIKSHGDYENWKILAMTARQNKIVRITLAASFASPCMGRLNALPFFLHAWGGTESGKSVAMMLAASVWGKPDIGAYIKIYNSTDCHVGQYAGTLNSLPLCLDEFQLRATDTAKVRAGFDRDIYMLAEGVDKGRGAKNGGVRTSLTWRNTIISNGETPLTTGNSSGGALNRVIEIDCAGLHLFNDAPTFANAIREHYGYAGADFVYAAMADEWKSIKQYQAEYYRQLMKKNITQKLSISASVILAADRFATEKLFDNAGGELTVDDIMPYLRTKNDIDTNSRAYDWLMDYFRLNISHFRADADDRGERWGCYSPDGIKFIKPKFDDIMSANGYSSASFLSWAKINGHIECDASQHMTRLCRISDLTNPVRCVCLKYKTDMQEISADEPLPF